MKRILLTLAALTAFCHSDEITGMNLRIGSTSIPQTPTATPSSILTLDANKRPVFTNAPSVTGQTLTGSQATPVLDLSTTWNTTGTPTAIKLNVTDTASNAASKLMDLQVGGASKFSVYKNSGVELANILNQFTVGPGPGAVNARFLVDTVQASVAMNVGCSLGWSSDFQSITSNSLDLILGRDSAATLQLGADAATTPTAQTIKAHDVTTGTGASLTIAGGKGSVAGGSVVLATSATNGAPIPRNYVSPKEVTLTDATDTTVVNIAIAAGKYLGGELIVTTHADDGTDFQAITEHLTFSAVNKTGTVTATIQTTPSTSFTAASAGTLTTGWSIVVNGDSVDIKNNATSSLDETTLKCSYQLRLNTDGAGTVTP